MLDSKKIYRIALIGPESTGKTNLCKNLAAYYDTVCVPEYSRTFVESLNRKYNKEDVLHCIAKQFEMEKTLLSNANKILISDTESIMGKVWMEDVFKTCPDWVEKLIHDHPHDLYLLTAIDIPFENDPVRENPHRRDFFFEWYERELKLRNLKYAIVTGTSSQRLENAIKIIDEFLTNTNEKHT